MYFHAIFPSDSTSTWEWDTTVQDEVNKLIDTTLGEREKDIIRLYYGLDNECLTWEDISKRWVDA